MKTNTVLLAAIAAFGLSAGPASAASPSYCALYAKEFVKHAAVDGQGSVPSDQIHDRAYHKCLNMDDEPLLPTAYVAPASDGNVAPSIDEGSRAAAVGGPLLDPPPADAVSNAQPAQATPSTKAPAVVQPDPKPAETSTETKTQSKSWIAGVLGKFRRPSPPPEPESVLGKRGLTMTSWERRNWCAKQFPKSYDPKTGTVVPHKTGVRTKC